MTPDGLAALIESANRLSEDTVKRLWAYAHHLLGSANQLSAVVVSRLSRAASRPVDWTKVSETVVFLCQGKGVSRTKLNKLLFYADFLHMKHFGSQVTGLPYVRLPHGPVPDQYELVFAALHAEGLIDLTEAERGENVTYMHRARRSPDIAVFTTTELQALTRVQAEFENKSAKDISRRSHQEDAWQKTPASHQVSLIYAKTLSLSL